MALAMATTSVSVDVGGDPTQDFGGQRRMSVADTLVQATKALRTHRDWMKRRISVVTPLEEDEVEARKENNVAWEAEGSQRTGTDSVGNVANGHETPRKLQATGAVAPNSGAPPLFSLQGFGSGGAAAAQEWVEFLKQKRNLAKVAPVHTLRSVAEEVEGSPKSKRKADQSRPAWGSSSDVSKAGGREPLSLLSYDTFRQVLGSGAGKAGGGDATSDLSAASNLTATKLKKRKVSKASIVPSTTAFVQPLEDTDEKDGTGLADSNATATSPANIFVRPPPNTSSPPHGMSSINAWGSLSSLDTYMDTLDSRAPSHGGENREETKGPQAVLMDSEGRFDSKGGDETMASLESGNPFTIVARSALTRHQESTMDTRLPRTVYPVPHLPEERGPGQTVSDASVQDENAFSMSYEDQLDTLQSASTATVVSVRPAPKDQRSSYDLHSKSKLELSESGLKLINTAMPPEAANLDSQLRVEGTRLPSANRSTPTGGSRIRDVAGGGVPEAILQPVLPAKKQRRTGAIVIATTLEPVYTSKASSGQQTAASTHLQAAQESSSTPVTSHSVGAKMSASSEVPRANKGETAASVSQRAVLPIQGGSGGVAMATRNGVLQDLSLPPLRGVAASSDLHIGEQKWSSSISEQDKPLCMCRNSLYSIYSNLSLFSRNASD